MVQFPIKKKEKANKSEGKWGNLSRPDRFFVAVFVFLLAQHLFMYLCAGCFLSARYLNVSLVAVFVKRKQWPPSWRHLINVELPSGPSQKSSAVTALGTVRSATSMKFIRT